MKGGSSQRQARLILKVHGGLGNRMRAIDSAVALAKEHGRQLTVVWQRDAVAFCRYRDLFEVPVDFDVIEARTFGVRNSRVYVEQFANDRPSSSLSVASSLSVLHRWNLRRLGVDVAVYYDDLDAALLPVRESEPASAEEFEELSYPIIAPVVRPALEAEVGYVCSCWRLAPATVQYQCFQPRRHIRARIESVASQFERTVGLHIRRTDHRAAIARSGFNEFVSAIEEELAEDPRTSFFLATDDRSVEDELRSLYPGSILSYQKHSRARDETTGVRDAVVDLYLLARTTKIYGSYLSSFSSVSAAIGTIENVTIC